MRIAQIAPLFESVPPRLYGGTERVVAHLSNELARRGHDVLLFASGDSKTLAELVPCRDVALRLDEAAEGSRKGRPSRWGDDSCDLSSTGFRSK
jgi:hypothetical protein